MKQYISVDVHRNQFLVREIVDGKERLRKVPVRSYLFQKSNVPTDYKDFYGESYVQKVQFKSGYEMKEFLDTYKDMPDEVWGTKDTVAQFIHDEGYDTTDMANLIISYLDIEVCTRYKNSEGLWEDGGFPEASEARWPINAICDYRSDDKKYHVFTTAEGWTKEKSKLKYANEIEYVYCKTEQELLKKWMTFWIKHTPHIITGWNAKIFDIPYIVNRIHTLFGEDIVKRLSPFGVVYEVVTEVGFGNKEQTYIISGISVLDYLDLYKKYRLIPREKYTLDYISGKEIPKEQKLHFKGTHGSLYYDDPVFFVDYNVQDVRCVVCFESLLQLIHLAVYISYMASVNFKNNLSPINVWETYIANTCLEHGHVIPVRWKTPEKKPYEGAYVHEPVPGLKGCVASFDYTSLYPKIMELFYMGADVYCRGKERERLRSELQKVLEKDSSKESKEMLDEIVTTGTYANYYMEHDIPESVTKFLKKNNVCMIANCEFFKIDRESIFVSLITKLFNKRKADKKTSFEYKHKAQDIKEELKRRGINLNDDE